MAITATRSAGSEETIANGDVAWSLSGDITIDNSSPRTASASGDDAIVTEQTFHEIRGFNFGFSVDNIPNDATITGVEARINRWYTEDTADAEVVDVSVRLVVDDGFGGRTTTGTSQSAATWSTTFTTTDTIGGDGNTWGAALTPTDVANANFGVSIIAKGKQKLLNVGTWAATANIDFVEMLVYWTQPAAPISGIFGWLCNKNKHGGRKLSILNP